MARKRKKVNYNEDQESEESEWEAEDSPGDDDDSDDSAVVEDPDDDLLAEEEEEKKKPPPKKKNTPRKPVARKKPAAKKPAKTKEPGEDVIFNNEEDETDYVPSSARLTSKGGYAHLNATRLKISKANRGNVPWNKGKNRSDEAKAKIAAGVRARNRAFLLQKLEKLGMTEEEWNEASKQVKMTRERLRRARKVNKEKGTMLAKQKREEEARLMEGDQLPGEIDQSILDKLKAEVDREIEMERRRQQQKQTSGLSNLRASVAQRNSSAPLSDDDDDAKPAARKDGDESEGDDSSDASSDSEEPPVHPMLSIFAPDIHWTPHPFSSDRGPTEKILASYQTVCPNGGPGGLVCCSVCTATYSQYLSSTYRDLEEQRTSKVAEEMEHLLGFMRAAKARLTSSVRAARKKNPPVNRKRILTIEGPVTTVVQLPKKPSGSIPLQKK